MNFSEFLDEIREIERYSYEPEDWRDYLKSDDYYIPDIELNIPLDYR